MQTVEFENSLNLSILPANAQQELIDFYQFLVERYANKQTEKEITNPIQNKTIQSLKGAFSQFADESKIALEDSAWEKHLANKYRHD